QAVTKAARGHETGQFRAAKADSTARWNIAVIDGLIVITPVPPSRTAGCSSRSSTCGTRTRMLSCPAAT
ncbi:hypothetical protein AB0L13_44010, partial [Saccharopolyspora shandongensis]|uniref:hypothetical protein n=1 Tax=Saccharopolyspora shandongensis TaxID=418495 RepID=UPI003413D78F